MTSSVFRRDGRRALGVLTVGIALACALVAFGATTANATQASGTPTMAGAVFSGTTVGIDRTNRAVEIRYGSGGFDIAPQVADSAGTQNYSDATGTEAFALTDSSGNAVDDPATGDPITWVADLPAASAGTHTLPADLPGGTYTLTAQYSGDGTYAPSTNTSVGVIEVVKADSAVTVSAPDTQYAVPGVQVDIALTSSDDGGANDETGSATITDQLGNSCTIDVATASSCDLKTASGADPVIPVGTEVIFVSYTGDRNYTAATGDPQLLTVTKTDTTLTASGYGSDQHADPAAPSVVSASVASSLDPTSANYATGEVTVTDHYGNTCTIADVSASHRCDLKTASGADPVIPAGVDDLTVSYAGDSNYAGSTGTGSLTIARGGFTPTVSLSRAVTAGQPTTATVGGLPADATGSVTIIDSSGTLCTITLPDTSCTYTPASSGTVQITASYLGDTNYVPSASSATSITVAPGTPTVTATANPVAHSDPSSGSIPVTVSVSGGAHPTGSAVVTDQYGNTCTITDVSASQACDLKAPGGGDPAIPAGTDAITATYGGDANNAGATGTGSLTVAKGKALLTVNAPGTISVGQPATITAAGLPADATGTVKVTDGSGRTLCTITLPATSCTFTPTTSGSFGITATYGGDDNYSSATANGGNVTVTPASTSGNAGSGTNVGSTDGTTPTSTTIVSSGKAGSPVPSLPIVSG